MTAIAPMPSEPSVNPWLPKAVTIGEIEPEIPGVATYQLDFADDLAAAAFSFRPGQFNMLYLPAIGEVAISISSDPTGAGPLLHTIRAAGSVTSALARNRGRDSRAAGPVRFVLADWQLQGPGHRDRLRRRRAGPAPARDL